MKITAILVILLSLQLSIGAEENTADEEIIPLPDPPTLAERVTQADLILKVRLVKNHTYTIGKTTFNQVRFESFKTLKKNPLFRLQNGEHFTVMHRLIKKWGPYFQEAPETGEYILFLQLDEFRLNGDNKVYLPKFMIPHAYSLENESEIITELTRLLK